MEMLNDKVTIYRIVDIQLNSQAFALILELGAPEKAPKVLRVVDTDALGAIVLL